MRFVTLIVLLFVSNLLTAQIKTLASQTKTTSALTLSVTTVNATCENRVQPDSYSMLGDGSLTATATGGTPPYIFNLSSARPDQSSGYFPGLNTGNYAVVVKDAAGATVIQNIYISANKPQPVLEMDVLQVPSTCTSTDGSIILQPAFGTPPYTFSTDGAQTFHTSPNITGLEQGNMYVFWVKDANGCLASTATAGGGPEGPHNFLCFLCCPLQVNGLYTKLACTNDGVISVWVNNSPGPIYYSLDGINYTIGNGSDGVYFDFTNLTPGIYHVYAKNDLGYTGQASFIMSKACAVSSIDISKTDPSCNQQNGSIFATANFGTAPYMYSLDGINYQNGNTFSGLPAGNYTIWAKDAGGSLSSAYTTLTDNCPQVSATFTPENCSGADAAMTVTATGGESPYQYSIDGINFQSSNVFSDLSAGNYTVTLQDGSGETTTVPVLITGTVKPVITDYTLNPFCENATGRLSLVANGIPPFQFSIDNGLNYQSSNVFTDLPAGAYPVLVEDASGCIATFQPEAIVYPVTPVKLGNDTILCAGQSITLLAPTSVLYQYLWQDNSQLDHYDVIQPGTYILKLINENNCVTGDTIQVSYTNSSVFTLGPDATLCTGTPLKLKPAVSGDFLWSDGSQGNSLNITGSGLYWLEVDNQKCSFRDSILITFKPTPVIQLGNDTSLCQGETLLLDVANPGGTYQWQDGNSSPAYQINGPGTYSVKVSLDGCDTSGKINVSYIQKPAVPFNGDTTLCVSQQLLLNAYSSGSDYIWQDGSQLPQFTIEKPGNYLVHISNTCGSVDATMIVKYENCDCHFYIPNAFTPNNDGRNDIFKVHFLCLFDQFDMKIFNRWGQLVFSSVNANNGWDGTTGNLPQVDGTYVWMIHYHDQLLNKTVQKNGVVILTR